MELKKAFGMLKKSEVFRRWEREHKKAYLCSCFVVIGKTLVHSELSNWQFDFYYGGNINSFVLSQDGRTRTVEKDKAFKEKEAKITPLNLEDVKINLDDAFKIVCKLEEAKGLGFEKKIVVVQDLGYGAIWNLSMITDSFSVLNTKISAKNGKVISKEIFSLLSLKAG
ncbi:MAG: hypothetical protein KKG60_03230 [Nanoarchaeota archaeon]|nr:hypothetical protein [Nanoarchaeota archaeon]